MEIMSKVICPYCKEWLDLEKFLTIDDLKEEHTYKKCYLCNKNFTLRLNTTIFVRTSEIEEEIEDIITPRLFRDSKWRKEELEKLYELQKDNEKK